MTIRVLHIFSPYLRRRFGGMTPNWRYYFNQWHDVSVEHYVLDTENQQIANAVDAFSFKLEKNQKLISRRERIVWIFSLHTNLIKYQEEYDFLHFHVLWWGGLLMALWSNLKHIPSLYESVLLDSDTPGSIQQQRFGKIKLWLLKKFKGILAISESLALDYKLHGFGNGVVHTLKCSIDTELFRPPKNKEEKQLLRQKYNFPQDKTILTFVGSLIHRKGIDLLINAFIEAYKENPDLYLLLVGPSNQNENPTIDETLINKLVTNAKNHGAVDQIKKMGLIQSRQKLAEIYRASDMFVFPSRQEGLGIVVLEAMCTSLPVIVSQLPVLENVIKIDENGIIVPLENKEELKNAIHILSTDLTLKNKLGKQAHQTIIKNHDFAHWQTNLVAIYQKLSAE